MRLAGAVVAAVLGVALIAHAQETEPPLAKLNCDDAAAIGLSIQTDAMVKTEGKASIKITTHGPVTVCLGDVSGPDVDNAKLTYRAKVKTNFRGDGYALAEMWVVDDHGYSFARGMNDVVGGQSDWKTVQTSFLLQPGQKLEKVIFNLTLMGEGTVWVDDIVLTKEPLK